MKSLQQLIQRVTWRTGILMFAAIVVLALSSTSERRTGLLVLAATAVGAATQVPVVAAENSDTAIRPFRVAIPEKELVDLRRRVAAMRWPTKELVGDRTQGVQLATLKELARYWTTDYDWRKGEA